MINFKELIQNRYAQLVIVGITSFGLAFLFKPSTTTTEELEQKHQEEVSMLKNEMSNVLKSHIEIIAEKDGEFKKFQADTETKIASLRSENTYLKQKNKTRTLKIVKPDGTIVEESVSESDTESTSQIITQVQEEFKQKIAEVENRWKEVHEERVTKIKEEYEYKESEYRQKISELLSKKQVVVNEKKLGIELGYTTKKTIYSHMTYDFASPFFLGGHVENYDFGVGFGVRL